MPSCARALYSTKRHLDVMGEMFIYVCDGLSFDAR